MVLSVCSRLDGGEDVVARVREEIWSRVGQWGDCHRCGKKLHKKVGELAGRWERAQQQLADKVSSSDTSARQRLNRPSRARRLSVASQQP